MSTSENQDGARPPEMEATGRRFRHLAFVVLGVALLLRGVALDRFSLGNDEIDEVRWSRESFPRLLSLAAADGVHPPLEFSLQTLLTRAGAPEWARRVPAVLAGVGSVALTIFIATRWFGPLAGLVSGLFLAFSPIHVRYSQEVRPYSLGLFLLLASVAALDADRSRPRAGLAWLWFLSVAAAAYTLYFAGLFAGLLGIGLIALFRKTSLRHLWKALPLALAGWILLYLPWLPVVLSVARKTPPTGRETLDRAWLAYRLQVLGTGDWLVEPISPGSWAFWALVAIGIVLARRSRLAVLAAAWFVLGAGLLIAILQLRPHFPAVRYLLPAWLASVVLAGYAVSQMSSKRRLRLTSFVSVGLVLAFDLRTLSAYYDHGRPEWNEVAEYVRRNIGPHQRVVAVNFWTFRNFGYYWADAGPGVVQRPPLEWPGDRVSGPAWIVLAACPLRPEARGEIERLRLLSEFPLTNHCEVRFLPEGESVTLSGICSNGI
jgi:dolichyl-phosphate-mannose-protein mannosyltransferase